MQIFKFEGFEYHFGSNEPYIPPCPDWLNACIYLTIFVAGVAFWWGAIEAFIYLKTWIMSNVL